MAKATTVVTTKPDILLTLTHEEATWLYHNMQNPLHLQRDTPDTEELADVAMREELFTVLREALYG